VCPCLKAGMVVTCEPGIYFVDGLLGPAYEDPMLRDFLVRHELDKFHLRRPLYTPYTPSIPSLCTPYTPPIHPLHTPYSPLIHPLSTPY